VGNAGLGTEWVDAAAWITSVDILGGTMAVGLGSLTADVEARADPGAGTCVDDTVSTALVLGVPAYPDLATLSVLLSGRVSIEQKDSAKTSKHM
jgi:hypothetical protein